MTRFRKLPDQTYDNWVARGESAYSGGLYLAALRATTEMARRLGDLTVAASYDAQFKKGQAAYIKNLWNGAYFNYDQGSRYHDSIMAEQLAGQWYANLAGLGDLVPKKMRQSVLQQVFDSNVMKFANGEMGAVNGFGVADENNEQVAEVWTGTTFGVASHMLSEGMREQAFHTAKVFITSSGEIVATGSAHPRPTTCEACIAPACTCALARFGRWRRRGA